MQIFAYNKRVAIAELLIRCIDEREFDGLREEWNDLLGRSSCDSVW